MNNFVNNQTTILSHITKYAYIIALVLVLVLVLFAGTVNAGSTNITDGINSLAFNQAGILASARDDGRVTLWNTNNASIIKNLYVNYSMSVPNAAITDLVFSSDGTLVTSSLDSVARRWNISSGLITTEFQGHEEGVLTTAVSPNGQIVATGGQDTKVMLWDVTASRLKAVLEGHKNFVRSIAFGSNTIIASGSDDGVIKLWNVSNRRELLSIGGKDGGVNIIAFSPDKSAIVSGTTNGVVKEWNVSTGQIIRTYMTSGASINAIAYAPKVNILVAAGDDGNIRVWNRATGALIITLNTKIKIRTLAYSIDSKTLVSAGANNIINVWNTTTWKYTSLTDLNTSININTNINQIHPSPKKGVNNTIRISNTNVQINSANSSGPGGPILIVTSTESTNPFGSFYAEILRAEGFNAFREADISTITASTLSGYDIVILAEIPLTLAQVTMFSDWVNGGGRLISMRPDQKLNGLLGLTDPSGTLNGSYILINTTNSPGSGLVGQTIQFKGIADLYTLNGSTSIATLYRDATTPTNNPAVALRNVGNGQVASFTYDLAKSIVYMRQGNPAWVYQERDGYPPMRSDDLYFGAASFDPQPDWIDLNKVSIPQADEQQRLLANIIIYMTKDIKPLPRFWYLPNRLKAAVVMTGDDHANGGTPGRFDQFIALSPTNCNVGNWECIRGTSYIYPGDIVFLNDSQAHYYQNQGFEIGIHVQSNCADYTADELDFYYYDQINSWTANYPSLIPPHTHRMHCIAWDGWTTQPSTEINHSIVLDTSYYYWPPGWVANRPGYFTGSGIPMRFSDLNGNIIDVYQAETQMTDESGQSYPFTSDSLLDRAVGPEQYFGIFTVNAHTDLDISSVSDSVVRSALTRGIPIISSSQLLDWINGREQATYGNVSWNGNVLAFSLSQANITGLQVQVPAVSNNRIITSVNVDGNPTNYIIETINGMKYAFIGANTGAFEVTYSPDFSSPMITGNTPAPGSTEARISTTVTSIFNKPMDESTINNGTFQLYGPNGAIVPASVTYNTSTFEASIHPTNILAYSTNYTVIVNTGVKDIMGNSLNSNYSWSFTTASGPICPCSIWSSNVIPGMITVNDPNAVELGLKFRSDVNGNITGIRFYKGPFNTGTHVGSLWDDSGVLLGRVTFSGEGASGWQQANFITPIAVTAGRTYIASYHTNVGYYSADNYYFISSGFDNPPLHALQNGVDGGNGVYIYNLNSTFPTNPASYTNYWVDVVLSKDQSATPMPVNLAMKQGNFWINYTWFPGSGGNIIDSYNVSIDGLWTNGSSDTYKNYSVGPHNWSNIIVYAYNNSNKQLSSPVTMSSRISNNIPVLQSTDNKNISAGQVLEFNVHALDADNDTIIYETNASKGTLNTTTGDYIWPTTNTDIGNYTWYFNASDSYGGLSTETITVVVNSSVAPNITSWSNSKTNDYNLSLTVNTGEIVNFNAKSDQNITTWNWYKDGLNQNNTFDNLTTSWNTEGSKIITVNATNINGTSNTITWNITAITATFIPPSPINVNSTEGNFWINTTWEHGVGNMTDGYNVSSNGAWTNGTNSYVNNSEIAHGWQNITIYSYNSSGSGSLSIIPAIYSTQIPNNLPVQSQIGNKTINEGQWLNFTVHAIDADNDTIIYGTNASKGIFNTSTGYFSWNTTYVDSGVYVWSFNSSDSYGGLANEDVIITVNNVPLNISASPSSDPITTYGTNQNFNINLSRIANVKWYMNGIEMQSNPNVISSSYSNSSTSVGIWNVSAIATDGIDIVYKNWNWTINSANYVPQDPTGLNSTTGNFWINYTWIPGIGNKTDSFNVSINGIWDNNTLNTTTNIFKNVTTVPHGWVNITVWAYNSSGTGTISLGNMGQNIQVPNNPPVQSTIGNKTIDEGQYLTFYVTATDIDNDNVTYNTNATKGNFNTTTGQFSWIPIYGDAGIYVWNFNSSDGYGGIASETITINVNEIPLSITNSSPESDPLSMVGSPQTFTISLNRTALVNWYINESIVKSDSNTSSSNYTNSSAGVGTYNVTVAATDGFYSTLKQWNWTINSKPAPNITSWNNNKTDDNSLILTTNINEPINFNATANQTITTWNWYKDGINQNINYDNFSTSWNTEGSKIVTVNGTNNNGTSNTIMWNITVLPITEYIPPSPINMTSMTGNFWANTTWEAGLGNITDSYNVSINGTWFNNTGPYINNSLSAHGWQNITVYSYNSSGSGSLSTPVSKNTQVANNIPIQNPIGDKIVHEGEWLNFTINTTDLDNDLIIYGTNATKGNLSSVGGNFTWLTTSSDAGNYTWYFNSSDGYGGISSESITVTVISNPLNIISFSPLSDPTTIQGAVQLFNVTLNKTANVYWYINGSIIKNDSNVLLSNITNSTAEIGTYNVTVIAIDEAGSSVSKQWNWTVNQPIYSPIITSWSNNKTNNNNLTITVNAGDIINFNATANQTITIWSWYKDNLNQNDNYDNITTSWNTTGSKIITVNATNSNGTTNTIIWNVTVLPIIAYIPPDPIYLNNTIGNFWINYTWIPGTGNLTDSYNVSINETWTNGTAKFKNTTSSPHGWANITVWAYNSSGIGTMSIGNINQNIQIPNNPPIQAPIGNKTVTAGNLLNFTVVATDIDNDNIIYGTNATKGNLNTSTGIYSWQTTNNDNGTYVWYFNSSDNFGGIANEIITINVASNEANRPMVVGNIPLPGTIGVNISTTIAASFNEAMNSTTINSNTFELHAGNATGTIVPANVSYNSSAYKAILTPSSGLTKATNYTAIVKGGTNGVKDIAGYSMLTNYIWNFTTSPCPCSIWSSPIPANINVNDASATELGVKFRSDINGSITGIRFYKGSSNTGTHVGTIWSNTGTQLGRVTFSGESASGWQQANFTTPVNITAGTIYVASYHTNIGYYSDNNNYFATSGFDNTPLHALKNGVSGSNGVYIYSSTPKFPNKGYLSTNYWVDIVFVPR